MRIWHVAREMAGVADAGGVKDVVAGLAEAAAGAGHRCAVVLPRYGFIDTAALGAEESGIRLTVDLPADPSTTELAPRDILVWVLEIRGIQVYLLDMPEFSDKRAVYTYTPADEAEDPHKRRGTGHWDAHIMNLGLQKGALELGLADPPEVFHCHDGHTAFLPALMAHPPYRERYAGTGALLTIHNAGTGYHQEIHDAPVAEALTGLPRDVLARGELAGAVDPLVLGSLYATTNTVSENYARELLSGEHDSLTGGLGSLLASAGVELHGVTNGINPRLYHSDHGREGARRRLGRLADRGIRGVEICGGVDMAVPAPLYAFVGRMTWQKGMETLLDAVEDNLGTPDAGSFFLLGQGEQRFEERAREMARRPEAQGRMAVALGYSEDLALAVFAGGDFFLIPSIYEPCGLTDFIAQLHGNLPIVHRVGGLVKVEDGVTGFSYDVQTREELGAVIRRTGEIYRRDPGLLGRMRTAAVTKVMQHHTWDRVFERSYLALYHEAVSSCV